MRGTEIIAHRGASGEAPENTLAAFRRAFAQGADGIEGDFRLTRDGEIVCLHDATTGRTAGADLVVADTDLARLRALDVGAWKGPQWAGERIPTLAEVLGLVPAGKRLYIELKSGLEILPHALAGLVALAAPAAPVSRSWRTSESGRSRNVPTSASERRWCCRCAGRR